jgi:hypothetical protein
VPEQSSAVDTISIYGLKGREEPASVTPLREASLKNGDKTQERRVKFGSSLPNSETREAMSASKIERMMAGVLDD